MFSIRGVICIRSRGCLCQIGERTKNFDQDLYILSILEMELSKVCIGLGQRGDFCTVRQSHRIFAMLSARRTWRHSSRSIVCFRHSLSAEKNMVAWPSWLINFAQRILPGTKLLDVLHPLSQRRASLLLSFLITNWFEMPCLPHQSHKNSYWLPKGTLTLLISEPSMQEEEAKFMRYWWSRLPQH